jgi:hypothetical protein
MIWHMALLLAKYASTTCTSDITLTLRRYHEHVVQKVLSLHRVFETFRSCEHPEHPYAGLPTNNAIGRYGRTAVCLLHDLAVGSPG